MPVYAEPPVSWKKLGWLCRKSSVTPAGDRAATECKLPRIVIQTAKRFEWRGCPIRYTVSRVRTRCPVRDKADHISRTHKKGDRARPREHVGECSPTRVTSPCPERISAERRL